MTAARKIHSGLKAYLDLSRFAIDWPVIRRNCPDAEPLRRQFHVWFDSLKTLRLVHHLSCSAFPPVPMYEGLKGLLDLTGQAIPSIAGIPAGIPEPDIQFRILEELRSRVSLFSLDRSAPAVEDGLHAPALTSAKGHRA